MILFMVIRVTFSLHLILEKWRGNLGIAQLLIYKASRTIYCASEACKATGIILVL